MPPAAAEQFSSLLRQLDLKPMLAGSSIQDASSVRFACLLECEPLAMDVVADWSDVLAGGLTLTPAEALLFEWKSSWDPEPITSALPPRLTYLKTVHTTRQRAALALHDYAREVNWRRPVVYLAALRIARAYFRTLVANEAMTAPEARREFTGRLGVSTLLASRFIEMPAEDLMEAVENLERSVAQGNDPESAYGYWVEGQIRIFDGSRDADRLQRAARHVIDRFGGAPPNVIRAHLVDAALRLDDPSILGVASMSELPAVLIVLSRSRSSIDAVLRYRLTSVLIEEALKQGLPLAALRLPTLPFGFRLNGLDEALAPIVPALVSSLKHPSISSEPLARSLAADFMQLMHGLEGASNHELEERIRLRSWPGYENQDDRNTLLRSRDQLLLSQKSAAPNLRASALADLAAISEGRPSTSASALILIAQDVEEHGPCSDLSDPSTVAVGVRTGDVDLLLHLAATAAQRSPDLLTVRLGGRSNVTTIGDLYDLVGETFVFKHVYTDALVIEEQRSNRLAEMLRVDSEMGSGYAVTSQRLLRDAKKSAKGIAVRRFERGHSARDYVQRNPEQESATIERVVTFLGWMNRVEGLSKVQLGRGALKDELGMYLKTLGYPGSSSFFDRWWANFDGVPGAPRRDAHLDNWIVSASGVVVAIDLEARDNRPLTYELAQVTEDSAQIRPNDFAARRTALDAYVRALRLGSDGPDLVIPYEASVLARALRHLTMPKDNGRYVEHGLEVLTCLRRSAESAMVAEQANDVLDSFARTRGQISSFFGSRMVASTRRRMSKQLAYLLRHDGSVSRDPGGWVAMGETANRLGITVAQLVEIASHPDEKRFQVNGESVRARYGHSVAVEMDYPAARSAQILFHGTSMEAASAILAPRGGIRNMGRQWVHLARDAADAYASALRKGDPLVLCALSEGLDPLWNASDATVLASFVPRGRTRVAPISFIWEAIPRLVGDS